MSAMISTSDHPCWRADASRTLRLLLLLPPLQLAIIESRHCQLEMLCAWKVLLLLLLVQQNACVAHL